MKDDRNTVQAIINCLGGAGNIAAVSNCMTRLRVVVKDEAPVDEQSLKNCDAVLSLLHNRVNAYEIVVGPGKCRRYADLCREMGLGSNPEESMTAGENWQQNKADWDSRQTNSRVKSALKTIGDIFIPLIPGIITAGLCAGFASLISQLVPNYAESKGWALLFNLLSLVNVSFMTYISAWVGYRAAERFGATPILGGMLGLITSLDGINEIAKLLGLYDEAVPLNSVLHVGKGGVLAVITGVLLLSYVEKKIRSRMPDNVDIIFTPLLSLLICAIPYITLFMPFFGYVSSGIVWVFSRLCLSQSVLCGRLWALSLPRSSYRWLQPACTTAWLRCIRSNWRNWVMSRFTPRSPWRERARSERLLPSGERQKPSGTTISAKSQQAHFLQASWASENP